MQWWIDIPDHIAEALPLAGESVEQSLLRAAAAMIAEQELLQRREGAVDQILALRKQVPGGVTLEEMLDWKTIGRL